MGWNYIAEMLSWHVDLMMLEQHLTQAEEHVALGERHIARQRELVAELEREGHDTVEARRLLANFDDLQLMHIEGRDRLRRKLGLL